MGCSGASGNAAPEPDGSAMDSSSVADSSSGQDGDAGVPVSDSAPPSDGPQGGLGLSCFATQSAFSPNPCPAPSGNAGEVDFCYRPAWSGVTSVDVYGTFGQPTDWQSPFLTLTNDGSGTFTGKANVPSGTYPYEFRVHGSVDNLVRDGAYLLDPLATDFVPSPPGSPTYSPNATVPRSMSAVTVPQMPAAVYHLRGKVQLRGQPQGCFSIDLEAGEVTVGGVAKQEHNTANFAESAADGTFDFPVVAGPFQIVVRYPFLLSGADAGYPDPSVTPTIGYARTGASVAGDTTLDPLELSYPDYASLSPTGGSATLPVTFTFTVIPGSLAASVAVIGTNIAGNDPAYWGPWGTTTSLTWDGAFGGMGGNAKLGTKYYWGTWQKLGPQYDGGTPWSGESFLYPITFH